MRSACAFDWFVLLYCGFRLDFTVWVDWLFVILLSGFWFCGHVFCGWIDFWMFLIGCSLLPCVWLLTNVLFVLCNSIACCLDVLCWVRRLVF